MLIDEDIGERRDGAAGVKVAMRHAHVPRRHELLGTAATKARGQVAKLQLQDLLLLIAAEGEAAEPLGQGVS